MSTPVLATKLFVPARRSRVVARERLIERLDSAFDRGRRLTLVSAPAGFGKTTLVSEWVEQIAPRAAWLSLDDGDNDPARFLAHLVTALGAEALTAQPMPVQTTLTVLVNQLTAAAQPTVLVLDDYHVIETPAVHDAVAFLLNHVPPELRLLILSRSDPPLPLARLRTGGALLELRAADLRFTPDEAGDFLNDVMGLSLSPGDVQALDSRTEGWVAGLQLAALSLRDRDDASAFIAAFTGSNRFVLDYLVEEVLALQPDDVRSFLLHTALLDRMTGPLCDAVTGRTDGDRMLEGLERANLFLVALDDSRRWYRYHHLFADCLRARMLTEARTLHLAASRWFEQHELLEDAIAHALAADDHERAGQLIELALAEIRRTRRDATLIGWLQALPPIEVRRRPVLTVYSGWMHLVTGDLDAAGACLDDAERALADPAATWPETDELRMVPATIAVYRAALAQARGDAAATAAQAQRVLELAGPDDHFVRAAGAGFLGLAAWAAGDVRTALDTFSQTATSLHAAGNHVDELATMVVLADMWATAGLPSKARRLLEDALQTAASRPDEGLPAGDLHVALAQLDREAGDLGSAHRHLETAKSLGDAASMTENRFRWFVAAARVKQAEGDLDAALALLDQAERHYRPGFFPEVRPIAAMKTRLRLALGDLGAPSTTEDIGYLREYENLTAARLLIAGRQIDDAIDLLGRLLEPARTFGREASVLEIRILQALAHDARGQRALAVETLEAALAAAPEPEGFVRLLLDEDAPMIALLRDVPQARRLLAAPVASGTETTLSERELQVLRLLDTELSGPEIARELYVSLNTLRTHTKHIFSKLDVTSRRAAVRRARDQGLL
jgi:LuxR family maltose regulon positive regulatory protein